MKRNFGICLALLGSIGPVSATHVPFGTQSIISTATDGAESVFAADVDGDHHYAVYEGTIGDFASHAALTCSTGPSTMATIAEACQPAQFLDNCVP